MYRRSPEHVLNTAGVNETLNSDEGDTKLHPLATLSYLAVAFAGAGGCAALHAII